MKKEIGGLLHRLLGRSQDDEAAVESAPLQLDDIQGIILRGYRMPFVRHFLLKVTAPTAAQAAWAPRQWRRNRRTTDHDREGLACWI